MENQIIQLKQQTKHDLIKQQSDIYLGAQTCLNSPITIIQDIIMPTAGIDQSNAPKNHFIIWPKIAINLQKKYGMSLKKSLTTHNLQCY